uniref:Uncharacterized protein n=1 Tax=Physcomitrium patens TaxID=3218 RepID=A0A2K1KMS8_PHYPA|nr:hypothetical protein PHYPA_005975 [Physcomitrium patens]
MGCRILLCTINLGGCGGFFFVTHQFSSLAAPTTSVGTPFNLNYPSSSSG